jgi:PAS domain S-box-containing protein
MKILFFGVMAAVFFPDLVSASQAHVDSAGICVHRIAHIFFMLSLIILFCKTGLFSLSPAIAFFLCRFEDAVGEQRKFFGDQLSMIVSNIPNIIMDVIDSVSVVVLVFLCLWQVIILRRRDSSNILWSFLFWFFFAVAVFSLSQSVGQFFKQIRVLTDHQNIWEVARPLNLSINILMFMAVGSVTFYFSRSWKIYEQILSDKNALQAACNNLIFLNCRLEKLVSERTEALENSAKKYRRISEVFQDMLLVSRMDGTIVDINPAGIQMLGLEKNADAFEGKNFQYFFDNAEDWRRLKEKIDEQGFSASDEISLKCQDGFIRRVLISCVLDKGINQGENTIEFLIKDIEQCRIMEQQLTQADKLASIGLFSAGIAHEINNPLGIILGYTQLLLRGEKPGTEKYQDLKTIEKHVRTCKFIVEDLLNFARGSKTSQDKLWLNTAIDEVISFIHQHSKLEQVEIIKDYDQSLPPLILDEKKIKQVLMNLMMNARHAVGTKGTIFLSTRYHPSAQQVVIQVTDTGCGIEEKNLLRIFDPFFTTKPIGEGTGMGLSVSYGIIKNHGGDIFVDSEPGKGTTFTVVLTANSNKR